jgi:hypothetical protein
VRPNPLLTVAVCLWGLVAGPYLPAAEEQMPTHATDWFKEAGWGVFTHYLTGAQTTAEAWNKQVEAFDVAGLAKQL